MMTTRDEVEQSLTFLEQIKGEEDPAPAMIILPTDADQFIIGNRAGLIELAIVALKAAEGEEQAFKGRSWVRNDDAEPVVKGLKLDPDAHTYLALKQTQFQQLRNNVLNLSLRTVILVGTLAGLVILVLWIYKMIWS
jgi:hypothetical protein